MDLLLEVKRHLSIHRYRHTLGVKDTAVYLARLWKANTEKAEVAALLHDWGKEYSEDQILAEASRLGVKVGKYDKLIPSVLHGPVGAKIVEDKFLLKDSEIILAIAEHTLGSTEMSLLSKIIFLADMIEPGRDYPGVMKLRELAESNLDEALLAGLDSTISFLISNNQLIHPQTIEARNQLLQSLSN